MKKTFILVTLMFVIISTLSYSALADKFKGLSPQQIENKMKELLILGKTDENEKILREYIEFLSNYEIPEKFEESSIYSRTEEFKNDEEFMKKYPKTFFTYNSLCYMFKCSEGTPFTEIDYNKLIKKYGKYVTEKYTDYLSVFAAEKMQEDAGICVPFDYIFKYIAMSDKFLENVDRKYDIEKQKIEENRKLLILMYFLGMENTPVIEGNNQISNKEALESYKRNIKKYGDTKTGKLLKEYYELLKKNRFYKTKEVSEFLKRKKLDFTFEREEQTF